MTHQRSQCKWLLLIGSYLAENSTASDIIKTFLASDSLDNQSSDYSSSNFTWSLTDDDSNQFQLDVMELNIQGDQWIMRTQQI